MKTLNLSIIKENLILLGLLLLSTFSAHAAYPEKPITLVVPYVAGASTDSLARLVGESVGKQLKQVVVIENKVGAGGTIAADYLRRQKPDGYTFMLSTDSILAVSPALYKSVPYDPQNDFTPLTIAVNAPLVLVVKNDSPFKNVQDLIAYAKNNPEKLNYGSAGVGTSQHMSGELFKSMADVKIIHVPYKGGGPAMNDLLGGHISMMFVQTASAEALAKAGKIRILATGSPNRVPTFPDTPTFDELGLKGYDSDTWYGFSLPKGVNPEIVKVLHQAIANALNTHKDLLLKQGYVIVAGTPDEMARSIAINGKKWSDVAKAAGIYQQQ